MRLPFSLKGYGSLTPNLHTRRQIGGSSSTQGGIIAVAVIAGIFIIAFFTWLLIRHRRNKTATPQPSRLQSRFKNTWQRWRSTRYSTTLSRSDSNPETSQPASSTLRFLRSARSNNNTTAQDRVDRHTSVRSIMTLPSYTPDVRPTEKIIAREGERAGIDTVVEYPETGEEEEARREEQMDGLYQLRVQRRQERTERETRRRLRDEARARGDFNALNDLRRQAQERAQSSTVTLPQGDTTAQAAVRIQEQAQRGRKISAVSYADVGVAKHDGSRVRPRADSDDSDRQGLLGSAASPDGRPASHTRTISSRTFRTHHHNQSASSMRNVLTPDLSDDERDNELDAMTPWDSRRSLAIQRTTSSHVEADLGTNTISIEPPRYEPLTTQRPLSEAPPYESPIKTDAPRIPAFAPLPALDVTSGPSISIQQPSPLSTVPGEWV